MEPALLHPGNAGCCMSRVDQLLNAAGGDPDLALKAALHVRRQCRWTVIKPKHIKQALAEINERGSN